MRGNFFPCMEFFSIHGKKIPWMEKKKFPWQSETDLTTYRDVTEVFTTSYKGVIYSRKYSERCSIPIPTTTNL